MQQDFALLFFPSLCSRCLHPLGVLFSMSKRANGHCTSSAGTIGLFDEGGHGTRTHSNRAHLTIRPSLLLIHVTINTLLTSCARKQPVPSPKARRAPQMPTRLSLDERARFLWANCSRRSSRLAKAASLDRSLIRTGQGSERPRMIS